MPQTLGFVGVGRMGGPMALRLLDAGFPLTVFDTNAEAVKSLVDRGATSASSAEAVASAADIVLMSLPTPPIVQAVSLGERGILRGSRMKTLIDLSTTGPSVATVVANASAERGVAWVDSPVSGGVNGAVKGTLAVMVSGPPAEIEIVRPALEVFGKVFVCGDRPGLAQSMKLVPRLSEQLLGMAGSDGKKLIATLLADRLPQRLVEALIAQAEIPAARRAAELTR